MTAIDIIMIPVVAIFILLLVAYFALELFFYLAYVRRPREMNILNDKEKQ